MSGSVTYMRPASRERLLASGATALSDSELVALFIGTGLAGQNCTQLSAGLLSQVGSLRELLLIHPARVRRLRGLGPARYARLQSALELARRVEQALEANGADGRAAIRSRLVAAVTDLPVQAFAAAFVNGKGECLACERMFHGTLRCVHVHPREVVSRALTLRAVAVDVARSDPEGRPLANESDGALRRRLVHALGIVGVELRHFYVVGQSCEHIAIPADRRTRRGKSLR